MHMGRPTHGPEPIRNLRDGERREGGWGGGIGCCFTLAGFYEEVKVLQVFSGVRSIVSKSKKKLLEADGANNFPTFAT